jgi:hypothetical protein
MNGRTNSALGLRHVALPLLALVAALTVARHAGWGQNAAPPTLEGTWQVTFTGDGASPPVHVELWTLTSNGGFIGTSTDGPEAVQGTWVQTADHTFNSTFVGFQFGSNGKFKGSFKNRRAFTVNDTFDALSGRSRKEWFDTSGNLTASGTGSVKGTRMRAEAIQ